MKRLFLMAMCMVAALSVMADDYNYLTFTKSDGTESSVAVSSLTITYSNGVLTATNGDGTTTFTAADLAKMYFATTASAVTDINADTANEPVTVYSIDGINVGDFSNAKEARASLSRGIYIVKSQFKTSKIVVP